MSNEITIICVYSKYSSYCQKFLKLASKIPDIKKLCIDNTKVRHYITHSKNIQLSQVPSLIVKNEETGENNIYQGDDAFNHIALLTETYERNEIEKRTKSEQNIKHELEKQMRIKQEKIENQRRERYNHSLDMHKQQLENQFKEKEKSIMQHAKNQIEMEKESFIKQYKKLNQKTQISDYDIDQPDVENENVENENVEKYDYDEFKQQRELHNERMQNHEHEMMKAQRQLKENQRQQERNNSVRGEHDSMNVRMQMAQQKTNAMKSRSNLHELTNLEDILDDDEGDDNEEDEALQNTINSSINSNTGNDIMALAQQMQNARDEPDSKNRGR